MITRYLLRVNSKKHPEIIEELEKHKQKDGIALYIRKLIEQDIKKRNALQTLTIEAVETVEIPSEPIEENIKLAPSQKTKISDESFGGGLA